MLDSAAIGAIIGAVARAGPEILKFIDRHLDRRHELAMQDKALDFEKVRIGAGLPPGSQMAEMGMVDGGQLQEALSLMRQAYSQQFNTGNAWLNGISILVRPTTTAILVWLYVAVKAVMMGAAWPDVKAMTAAYGDMDITILSGILSFWFVSRAIDKAKG